MTTYVTKAFGTKASRLSLTLLLPVALVGCATSERDRDAKEVEQQQDRQEMERDQQEDRQENERDRLETQQDADQREEGRMEQPNREQGQLGELNREQGQLGENKQEQGVLSEQGQVGVRGADERSSSTAGQYFDDTVITANVKAALAGDEIVKAYQVNVKTVKGVVQLSGFVSSDAVQSRADVVASAVDGVVSVENDLLVK